MKRLNERLIDAAESEDMDRPANHKSLYRLAVKRLELYEKALHEIAAIEDELEGGDWDEIEEARKIANSVLKNSK